MRVKAIFILLILFFFNPESLVTHRPGFDSAYLVPGNVRITNSLYEGKNNDLIQRHFNSFMRSWDIKGASIAISKEGRLVFAQGYGFADMENMTQTEPYHRFRIASVSKLITAVAIMKLCEDGSLTLEDKVFGPDGILTDSIYALPRDKRVYSITVGHLLGHQGGWTARYGDHMFITQSVAKQMGRELPLNTADYVRFALDKNLHFTPGKGRSYSNLGYAILGLVVEKVSGMTYESYCQDRLFEPLGIYDVAIGKNLESERSFNEVRYYEHGSAIPKVSVYGTGEIVPARYGGNDIESLGGAGAWIASAPDLMKLMLAIDGLDFNEDILSPESVKRMTNIANGYAPLGWKATYGNGVWWRTGFFPGTTAMMKRFSNGLSWVVLLNSSAWNGPELTNDINQLMSRLTTIIKDWPETDLLQYSLPVPLEPIVIPEPE